MILNLTQHKATPEQIAEGVIDLPESAQKTLTLLLTFNELPTMVEVVERAAAIALFATEFAPEGTPCMIGGAPYLMPPLYEELVEVQMPPIFAFSQRVSVEEVQPDGSVKKSAVFKHAGFVKY